jgi:hypothetical protein
MGMSPHEVYTRARQATGKRRDVLLHELGIDPSPRTIGDPKPRGRFFCRPEDTPRITDLLRRLMPEAVEENVARARRIAERRFDLLGFRDLDFGNDIDWSLDPVSGRRASNAPWPDVPFLDFSAVGDHKIVWELNRHQALVTLAKAYRFTADESLAAALMDLWRDWARKNPYPLGINWASTLEVAFRAMAWLWVGFLLEGSPADSTAFQRELAEGVARAGWYIERFLSTYFSPNTHLLGEGVALYLIGVRYPGLRHARRWKETGWKVTLEATERQVRSDGFYFEQSTYYHVYALDLFLHARILAAHNGDDVPKSLDETIRKMLSALALFSRTGAAPRYGDDDGGRLFDGSRNRPEHLLDPLSTGAALYRSPEFKSAAAGLCEETLWLLGAESAAAFDSVSPETPALRASRLPASGVYVMASSGPSEAQLFIDGGERGFRGSGHGHADALSIQLAAGGRLWLADPGTCRYVDEGSVRQRFRGTAAHNTLTVDGLDQAEPNGPFAWGLWPDVEVSRWIASEAFDLFEGRSFGYKRLSDPVIHRRWVLRLGARLWLVRDVAEGQGTHRFEIGWHFPPELAVEARGATVIARVGNESMALTGLQDECWRLTLAEGEYSSVYGLQVGSPVARWSSSGACPTDFAAAIGFGPEVEGAALTRLPPADGVAGYEYAAGAERRWFFFAAGGRAWRAGEWASDAAALYFHSAPGGIRDLVFAAGSYVEFAGKRAVSAPATQTCVECFAQDGMWRAAGGAAMSLTPEGLP